MRTHSRTRTKAHAQLMLRTSWCKSSMTYKKETKHDMLKFWYFSDKQLEQQ